jgi:hypothetical protein
VHFEITRFSRSYDGKIGKDNSEIAGQWKQGGASLQLSLKRIKSYESINAGGFLNARPAG